MPKLPNTLKSTQIDGKVKATNRFEVPRKRKKMIHAILSLVQTRSGRLTAWPITRLIKGCSPIKWLPAKAKANNQFTTGAFHFKKVSLWNAKVRPPKNKQPTKVIH